MSLIMSALGSEDDIMDQAVKYFLEQVQPELNHWALTHCDKFENVTDEAVLGEGERDLEHYSLFQEYVALFESRMEWFLTLKERTVEEFVTKCREGEEIRALGLPVVDGQFLDLMKIVDDFPGFLVFMRDEYNEKVAEPEEYDANMAAFANDFNADPPPKPEGPPVDPNAGKKFVKKRHIMPAAVTYFTHVVQPVLANFAHEHAEDFLSAELEQFLASGGTEGEHSLEHYELFKKYTHMFEELMDGFFVTKEITLEEFVAKCKEAEKEHDASLGVSFLEVIGIMDNFETFLKTMREEAKKQ